MAANAAVFMLNSSSLQVRVQERHFKLEQDEEAFMREMQANMGDQARMEQFLNQKAGGADANPDDPKSLGDMMKVKRTQIYHMKPKTLYDDGVDFAQYLNLVLETTSLSLKFTDFEIALTDKLILAGKMRILHDEFSKMPRGQITFKIDQTSIFKKDQYAHYRDLVFLFTKDVGKNGDTIVQKITEAELNEEEKVFTVKYETFLFDDFVKLEVFHKNSIQKNSKLGKAFVNIRELGSKIYVEDINDTGVDECMSVPITFRPSNYGEKKSKVNGNIFLRVEY